MKKPRSRRRRARERRLGRCSGWLLRRLLRVRRDHASASKAAIHALLPMLDSPLCAIIPHEIPLRPFSGPLLLAVYWMSDIYIAPWPRSPRHAGRSAWLELRKRASNPCLGQPCADRLFGGLTLVLQESASSCGSPLSSTGASRRARRLGDAVPQELIARCSPRKSACRTGVGRLNGSWVGFFVVNGHRQPYVAFNFEKRLGQVQAHRRPG